MSGEVGELCGVIKKMELGSIDHWEKGQRKDLNLDCLADEAADVLIYLDILCQRAGVDLSEAVINKFNRKSAEIGSEIKLLYQFEVPKGYIEPGKDDLPF